MSTLPRNVTQYANTQIDRIRAELEELGSNVVELPPAPTSLIFFPSGFDSRDSNRVLNLFVNFLAWKEIYDESSLSGVLRERDICDRFRRKFEAWVRQRLMREGVIMKDPYGNYRLWRPILMSDGVCHGDLNTVELCLIVDIM
jgi:hypothetical protein